MTEQTNIPKPASPLPWTDRGSFGDGDADIVSASGDSVYREYPYEGGWFQEPADLAYLAWAANNALRLYEALEDIVEHANTIAPTMPSGIRMIANRALEAARGEA